MLVASPRLPPTSLQPAINQGFPKPLFKFNNLLELLAKLRERLHLHLPANYKGYNSRRARWKRFIWQGMGGGKEMHGASVCSRACHPPRTLTHLPTCKLAEHCRLGVFMEVPLCRSKSLNSTSSSSLLS